MGCGSSSPVKGSSGVSAAGAAGERATGGQRMSPDALSKVLIAEKTAEGKRAAHLEKCKHTLQSTEAVADMLRQEGLSQARLVFAIDLTRANEWSGTRSFHGARLAPCVLWMCSMSIGR
jgi:hypothetical protein